MDQLIPYLSAHLFWEMDIQQLDANKHKELIVERVIARGSFREFMLINQFYGVETIKEMIKKIEYTSIKDVSFASNYYQIPLTEIEWFTKTQLNPNYFLS